MNFPDGLVEFARIQRRQREKVASEVAADFKDMADTRLFEEQYSKEDLEIVMDNLLAVVRATIKRDLAEANHGAVILLKQILEQAEGAGVAVRADLAAAEDGSLLEAVARWEEEVLAAGGTQASLEARAAASRADARLGQIGRMQDPKLVADLERATEANAQLAERVAKLRAQAETVGVDKGALAGRIAEGSAATAAAYDSAAAASDGAAALRAQVGALEAELAAVREAAGGGGGGGGGHDALRAELVAAQERVADLASQLGDAQAECVARVEKTKQAASLRQMLTKKNVLVKQLRDTLIANGIQP